MKAGLTIDNNNNNVQLNEKRNFNKSDWTKFKYISNKNLEKIDMTKNTNNKQ